MKRGKSVFALLVVLAVFCTFSCKKNPSWDTQILAPLIKTSLSIGNIVTNANINANPADSSVTLVFRDSLYGLTVDSLLRIPDTTLADTSYNITYSPITIGPGGSLLPTSGSSYTTYNLGGANLTTAIVQSGFVRLTISSTVNSTTDYTYAVPSATIGHSPLSVSIKLPPSNGTTPSTIDSLIPLNGYTVDFTGPNHNSYNQIETNVTAIVDPSAPAASVQHGQGVKILATFYNIVPYYGQGYFGRDVKLVGPSTSNFPLFNQISAGSLNLKNANVNFTIENGFGVDAQVDIKSLTSNNTRPGGTNVPLHASITTNTININRATLTGNPGNPVSPSIQTFTLNNLNSNITTWLGNLPNQVGYQMQIITDPLYNISGNTDFAYYGYGIKAYLDVSVPLVLAANTLTLQDTLPVSFANAGQATQIKSGTFTLYASNMFPFSAGLQIYLLNDYMQTTDSLMATVQTIAAGVPNADTVVVSPTNSVLTIPLTTTQASELFSTRNIIVKAIFNAGCTTCSPVKYAKILSTYQLNIKLIGNFDYQVKG